MNLKDIEEFVGRSGFSVPQSDFGIERVKNIVYFQKRNPIGGDTLLSNNTAVFML